MKIGLLQKIIHGEEMSVIMTKKGTNK